MKAFLALFVAVLAVSAHKGLDLSIYSGVTTVSQFQCLQKAGYDFMILEEWVENHAASNFEATYKNAIAAGYQEVDAYAFICNTCKGTHTAQQVIQGITGNLGSGFSGMIWLDIEPCSGCWSSNGENNFEFAKTIATTLQGQGHKIGIYSSGWAWNSVMAGVKSTYFSQFPLWYAHYDNVESFNDPNSYKFAGWTQPAMKQFLGDKKGQCNVPDYDIDWAPAFVNTNGNAAPAPANNEENKETPAPANNEEGNAEAGSSQPDANNSESKSSAQASNPMDANTPSSQQTSQSKQTDNNESTQQASSAQQSTQQASTQQGSTQQGSTQQASTQQATTQKSTTAPSTQ